MTSSEQQTAAPCVFVIFGATGDLTKRKLMPALYNLARSGLLPDDLAILGFGRRVHTTENLRRELTEAMRRFGPQPLDAELSEKIVGRVTYLAGDYGDPAAYEAIRQALERLDAEHGTRGNYLYYLATPPEVFSEVAQQLSAAGLARGAQPFQGWRRIVVEKPFGHDLASARALNGELQAAFDESQIFRIDHYLGKETVQNVLVFRFANGIFEPIWNRRYIDHVQITAAESVGVEGRGGYYESAGALRDMIQKPSLSIAGVGGDGAADLLRRRRHPRSEGAGAAGDQADGRRGDHPKQRARPVRLRLRRGDAGSGLSRGAERGARLGHRRRSRHSSSTWRTGAGRTCPSTCALGSAWRGVTPRSSSSFAARRSCSSAAPAPRASNRIA